MEPCQLVDDLGHVVSIYKRKAPHQEERGLFLCGAGELFFRKLRFHVADKVRQFAHIDTGHCDWDRHRNKLAAYIDYGSRVRHIECVGIHPRSNVLAPSRDSLKNDNESARYRGHKSKLCHIHHLHVKFLLYILYQIIFFCQASSVFDTKVPRGEFSARHALSLRFQSCAIDGGRWRSPTPIRRKFFLTGTDVRSILVQQRRQPVTRAIGIGRYMHPHTVYPRHHSGAIPCPLNLSWSTLSLMATLCAKKCLVTFMQQFMHAAIVTDAILSLIISRVRCAHRAQQHDNNDE